MLLFTCDIKLLCILFDVGKRGFKKCNVITNLILKSVTVNHSEVFLILSIVNLIES